MKTGLFWAFLLIAAWQDLEKKEINLWVFVIFGAAAVVALVAGRESETEWADYFLGVLPGLFLLTGGWFSRGQVGLGDGVFFSISGLYLGFRENLLLFLGSLFLCGLSGAVLLLWRRLHGSSGAGKETLPFLPFCVAAMVLEWGMRQKL